MDLSRPNPLAIPDIQMPSLSDRGVLVELSISEIRGSRKDKAATRAAQKQYGVQDPRAVNVTKNPFAGNELLKKINHTSRTARTDIKAETPPFGGFGYRYLACDRIGDMCNHMTGLEQQFNKYVWGYDEQQPDDHGLLRPVHVDGFLDQYEWDKIRIAVELGDLYNENDYPPLEVMQRKFKFSFTVLPIPQAGHFVADMIGEEFEHIMTTFSDYHATAIDGITKDMFGRVRDVLSTLSNQLDEKGGIHEKTFDTFYPLLDMLKTYNLTNDTQLEAVRQRLEEQFRGASKFPLNKDVLKCDTVLRAEAKQTVDEVLANLPSLDL